MKKLFAAALILAAAPAMAAAETKATHAVQETQKGGVAAFGFTLEDNEKYYGFPTYIFFRADTNNDGVLSRREYNRAKRIHRAEERSRN